YETRGSLLLALAASGLVTLALVAVYKAMQVSGWV
ncbi:hypothetical protein PSYMO_38238, partial [Pseudomonas amygdali pv. mori str. 301020]